ncbi:phosphate transporter [Parathielavia hyrcaniae]|uniref:Phosphate transporter n=1 Tax=Parathielavia hyrcaniae TaxID=113614 RepID=A0AAN6PQT7_9PEZI|nr:phosphate transporter [Parathielavia hyrcaniae]
MPLHRYDWILALITIAFCASSFGNGANDVANSYATSVAARSLTMPQVGVLSVITEFVGAVALGSRVTGTIKNDVIDITRFQSTPEVLLLAMACAEFGSAFWLLTATRLGFPVSTTQTIVGALVGVGIAAQAQVSWGWDDGSVSQIAASWAIAPLLAAAFSAILFATLKFCILEREDSLTKALRAIPFYLAFTGGVLALFITIEAPGVGLDALGAGTAVGIVLGTFGGCLLVAYVFFMPYFHRRLIKQDARLRVWHIPLGPLLWKENPPLYWPGKGDNVVKDYYLSAHHSEPTDPDAIDVEKQKHAAETSPGGGAPGQPGHLSEGTTTENGSAPQDGAENGRHPQATTGVKEGDSVKRVVEPEDRFLAPNRHLPVYHPRRLLGFVKYGLLQGVTRDCVTHSSLELANVHARARRYDNRVEHLWTYAQVASAMMMSIAHGSNDVANAVGPWVAAYDVWQRGVVSDDVNTPVWILIVAGFLLGAGFWFFGYHIIRSLGNKITQLSPTRGYAMELGAAITVLLASRLGLPVSTTQCLTGAVFGVALMNLDFGSVNWRQLGFIFIGWILTLPTAGLIAGLLMAMSLNTPQFQV